MEEYKIRSDPQPGPGGGHTSGSSPRSRSACTYKHAFNKLNMLMNTVGLPIGGLARHGFNYLRLPMVGKY